MNKKSFQLDAYLARHDKDERWLSSHEADCEQPLKTLTFLAVGKNALKLHALK